MRPFRAVVLSAVCLAVLAAGAGRFDEARVRDFGRQVVTDIRLPLQRHPNGRVKELFCADRAYIDGDGLYHVEGSVRADLFGPDGATNGVVKTGPATFDPATRNAFATGAVYLDFPERGLTLTGTNLSWNSVGQIVRVETNAVLIIHRSDSSVEAFRP